MNSNSPLSDANLPITIQQLRAELTYKKIREILADKNIDCILLKGPHLGSTVYNSPRERLYCDLDILVRPADFEKAAALLLENNHKPFAFDTYSPEIQRDFKHWEFSSPWGILVELHRWLSGHDRFPIDHDRLFSRAEKFMFGATAALGLATEDLLLHLCLHMGTSYFYVIERKHVLDIARLTRKKNVDWPVFLAGTKKAGAGSIAFYCLQASRLQDGAVVPDHVVQVLRPGFFRRRWLEKYIDPGSFPIYRFPDDPIKKVKRNLLLPLMDRPGQWARFVWRMAGTKFRMIKRMVKRK